MKAGDFPKTKKGWNERWKHELKNSEVRLRAFHKRAERVVKRYTDDRDSAQEGDNMVRLNLFWSNITVVRSMMFGSLPKVEVKRTYQDPDDDIGRVASTIMKRLLNNDIEENGRETTTLLQQVLEDRLVPGLGCARVRYEVTLDENDEVLWEDAPVDYLHWRDVRWGWGRTWADVPWVAFRTYLSNDDVKERFSAKVARQVEYTQQLDEDTKSESTEADGTDDEEKAEFWEIWHKDSGKVFWVNTGLSSIADQADDPLELKGFYPCPPIWAANCTTTSLEPKPDFYMVQDLYNEIDRLETRIQKITKAVKVVGAYDQGLPELKRMMQETTDNDLVPVENWAMFAEKGGMAGVIDWLPIADVVQALEKLEMVRDSKIALLFQIIGLSDIMRGQGNPTGGRVSAKEQQLKAQFGSIRVQALQDQFANFASDLMQIKAEVVARHFELESIAYRGTIKGMPPNDLKFVPEALQLIKDPEESALRIEIKPESVAMTDYAEMQEVRTEFSNALSMFMQSAAPLVELAPQSMPYLAQLMKWVLSGFKGSNEVEGILDEAIETMNQNPPQPPGGEEQDDSRIAEIQAKNEGEMRKIQASLQADLKKIQAKLQADLTLIRAKSSQEGQKEIDQAMASTFEQMAALESKIIEMSAEHEGSMEEINAQIQADKERRRAERAGRSQAA